MAASFARLHVVLARNAPLAVVIRRGPTRYVATMLWNRETDEFQMGQWLKGRIYERDCDLSPDGKFFLYFAIKGPFTSETTGVYTAISIAPYLKAIALFPSGGAWYGGGVWLGDSEFWLNESMFPIQPLRQSPEITRVYKKSLWGLAKQIPGNVYEERLKMEGWSPRDAWRQSYWRCAKVFEREIEGGWTLVKLVHSGNQRDKASSIHWEEHELHSPNGSTVLQLPHWSWAGWDRDRLVWATEGRLETGTATEDGMVDIRVLHDFNGMSFEPIVAPY